MGLQPGTRFGPYEVVAAIGAGGMGEVYRGRDSRLDRTVAIKVLPAEVANDPERLARFEREAKTLAALNHTNIAQIYGFEQGALVMEFVDGEDLSHRIAAGPIPLDDTLEIARQIVTALEAAHELGIIHRDLKPSNIRIRPDGTVKVLDFGLAKALQPASDVVSTSAVTLTSPTVTLLGTLLGTAAYMSPEQAKGRAVDKRADIWAFGIVLYEMLTGRRPFDGETTQETLAGVIKSEPDWSSIPAHLQPLLKSCLTKDPKLRLRDIGDWTRQISESSSRPASTSALWRRHVGWIAAALVLVAAAVLGAIHFREPGPPAPQEVRFQIPAPDGTTMGLGFAVAPNGRRVAFVASDNKDVPHLWVREFDAIEARMLAGTEGALSVFWKPDSEFIGFIAGNALKSVQIANGKVVTLCQPGNLGGGVWSPRGVIVFGGTTGGVIRQVPEIGGVPSPLTALNRERRDVVHGLPSMLPDGTHFLYSAISGIEDLSAILVGSLDLEPAKQDQRSILANPGGRAMSVSTPQGERVLFLRNGTLMSQPFDTSSLALVGQPTPVAEGVTRTGAHGLFSATTNALVYRTGPAGGVNLQRLTWRDREGTVGAAVGEPAIFTSLELSPNGDQAAVAIAPTGPASDIWVVDLMRGARTRLTTDPGMDRGPVWSRDGSRIAFNSNRSGTFDLYVIPANGSAREQLFHHADFSVSALDWTADERYFLYQTNTARFAGDIMLLPLNGDKTPIPIVQTAANDLGGRFSPNGRWISYTSNISDKRNEIFVRAFNPDAPRSSGAVVRVSTGGGGFANWSHDGRELYYATLDGYLMAVELAPGPDFKPITTRRLFRLPPGLSVAWDAAPDGRRFLVAMPTNEQINSPITVVLNWAK